MNNKFKIFILYINIIKNIFYNIYLIIKIQFLQSF